MRFSARRLSAFVFFSGACALIYQVVWQREFRLIFGASTAASGAVLAAFIGGLGAGSLLLARRVEKSPRPFVLYARFEAMIALTAAASPLLFDVVRWAYVAVGGTQTLGGYLGNGLRVLLAGLVVFVPTFFMGGTLPALARCATEDSDTGRGGVALLYGVNTIGAVIGSALATFFLLQTLGNRTTLWVGCLINLLVAVVANARGREMPAILSPAEPAAGAPAPGSGQAAVLARPVVLGAAFIVGAVFFLMELVWFRMLGPLLGGSVYTFGLVLCIALAGIGLGGATYGRLARRGAATWAGFALTCLLEALGVAAPFALGDGVALLTLLLRPIATQGFGGGVLVWTLIALVVVFPAAFVAGIQFPLLIALAGQARKRVAEQVGQVYFSNTLGAVLGSLAGGFGLLPWLSAPGVWRLAALGLLLLGVVAAGVAVRSGQRTALALPFAVAAATGLCLLAPGPSAVWRHSPIGAGRVPSGVLASPNSLDEWLRAQRRLVFWQRDGVEAAVALSNSDALSFLVNGKADGSAVSDAATQVMGGLLGAMLHPAPKKVLVIGLGTGSTAGWVAQVPGVERVDVMELEPVIVDVAKAMAAVNQQVLNNPKVHLLFGDARELLATSREKYDIVFSEPSNPYRIGIANLYTREYYQQVADHLQTGGLFIQWLQAYEVDGEVIQTAYATLRSVFGAVETWTGAPVDLLLVGSAAALPHDLPSVRARVGREPWATALRVAWFTDSAEGVFSHFIAGPEFCDWLIDQARPEANTDDDNRIEFGLARSVGASANQSAELVRLADTFFPGHDRNPPGLDPSLLRFERWLGGVNRRDGLMLTQPPGLTGVEGALARSMVAFTAGALPAAAKAWPTDAPVRSAWERLVRLAAYAVRQAPEFEAEAQALRPSFPLDVELIEAAVALDRRDEPRALTHLEKAFLLFRSDPWPQTGLLVRAIQLVNLGNHAREWNQRLAVALSQPFAARSLNEMRMNAYAQLLGKLGDEEACAHFYEQLEPNVFWAREHLARAVACFAARRPERVEAAQQALDRFEAQQPLLVSRGIRLPLGGPPAPLFNLEPDDAGTLIEFEPPQPDPAARP